MKASDYIIRFIAERGTGHIFGFIGGAITHLVDSAFQNGKVRFIQVYHEQTAAFAAEGYSRSSGRMGVAMATSGPGATNLLTGIGDAYFDSVPAVFITGQVNTYEFKYDKPIRQQGFQETDIVSIVKPITKYAKLLDDPKMLRHELEKAWYVALSGRPGPVLLDIPMDVQRAEIDEKNLAGYDPGAPGDRKAAAFDPGILEALKKSRRPLILAGGGVRLSRAEEALKTLAGRYRIPVVCSLMGKGAFPEDDGLFVGMIGSYGNRCANIVLANADLLLAIGTRLDTRQTGTLLDSFLREGRIIHVDVDGNEMEQHRLGRREKVVADARKFMEWMAGATLPYEAPRDWLSYAAGIKKEYSQEKEVQRSVKNPMPYEIMALLNGMPDDDLIFFSDIGQNQMFSAQMLRLKGKRKFFTSGGMAPMGYAMPAAIGACFADEKIRRVVAITGDGGFHISVQALMLISQYRLPIKVVVLNNRSLGMIVQFQNLYFGSRLHATTGDGGYLVPDIAALAKAYSLEYLHVKDIRAGKAALLDAFKDDSPAIIEFDTGAATEVAPKLEVNTPVEDLNPKLGGQALRKAMLIDLYKGGDGKAKA